MFNTEAGYYDLTNAQKRQICNGAGAANDWRSQFISNSFYGLDCTEVFNIHDYAYHVGQSEEDKRRADIDLLINLLVLIDANQSRLQFVLRHLRRLKAINYYAAVREFGHHAFFVGKSGLSGA